MQLVFQPFGASQNGIQAVGERFILLLYSTVQTVFTRLSGTEVAALATYFCDKGPAIAQAAVSSFQLESHLKRLHLPI